MMKSDYLWDKSGGDAEIEGLERLLSGFKYEPTAPPRPAAVAVNEPARTPWWKFSLAFAVPACLLFAVALGFWATQPGKLDSSSASIGTQSMQNIQEEKLGSIQPNVGPADKENTKSEVPKPVKTVFVPAAKSNSWRVTNTKHRQTRRLQTETLTAEEKFAYDQLKLALSITGSKLKVVSDTVNRAED